MSQSNQQSIENPTTTISDNVISWNDPESRKIGEKILNEAAKSDAEPFKFKAFEQNDWEKWFDFLADGIARTSERYKAIKYLTEKLVESFPLIKLTHKQRRDLVISLPDYLWAEQSKIENGTYQDEWETKEFLATAACIFLSSVVLEEPSIEQTPLDANVLYCVKKYLPHRTISNFESVYNKFFGDDLSPDDIQHMKDFGVGRREMEMRDSGIPKNRK